MSPEEQRSQNQCLHPLGTFPCDCGRPLTTGNSFPHHTSTVPFPPLIFFLPCSQVDSDSSHHFPRPTLKVLYPLSSWISIWRGCSWFRLFWPRQEVLPSWCTFFTIASLPVKISLQLPLISLSFCCRAVWYRQPQNKEHFGGCEGGFLGSFFLVFNHITHFWQQGRQTLPKLFLEEKKKSAPLLVLLSFTNKYTTLIFLEWASAVYKLSLNLYLFSLKTSSSFSPTYDTFDWELSSS